MPHQPIEFIHSVPGQDLLHQADRKRIRRHVLATRASGQKWHSARPSKSWLNPDLTQLPDVGPMSSLSSHPPTSMPRCLSSSLGLNNDQSGYEVTPQMLRELLDCKHSFPLVMQIYVADIGFCSYDCPPNRPLPLRSLRTSATHRRLSPLQLVVRSVDIPPFSLPGTDLRRREVLHTQIWAGNAPPSWHRVAPAATATQ